MSLVCSVMDLFEALKLKKACRDYTKDQVAQSDVDKLVYALGRAPTASNRPYRHCIVVDDPAVIRAIRQISPSLLADPSLLIIIFTDMTVALDKENMTTAYLLSEEEYTEFLDDLLRRFATEVCKRNGIDVQT